MDPKRRGRRAAWMLFGWTIGMYLLLVSMTRGTDRVLVVLLLMPVVGLAVAFIVSHRLPSESRESFWVTGILCIFLTMVIWGLSCGPALTR